MCVCVLNHLSVTSVAAHSYNLAFKKLSQSQISGQGKFLTQVTWVVAWEDTMTWGHQLTTGAQVPPGQQQCERRQWAWLIYPICTPSFPPRGIQSDSNHSLLLHFTFTATLTCTTHCLRHPCNCWLGLWWAHGIPTTTEARSFPSTAGTQELEERSKSCPLFPHGPVLLLDGSKVSYWYIYNTSGARLASGWCQWVGGDNNHNLHLALPPGPVPPLPILFSPGLLFTHMQRVSMLDKQ